MSLSKILKRGGKGVPSLVSIIDRANIAPEKLHSKRAVFTALNLFEKYYREGNYVLAERWFRQLVRAYESAHSRRDNYIHPSELLYGCPRALVYKVSGVDPTDEVLVKHTAATRRTFDVGTFYHRYIQDLLKQTKELYYFKDEVKIKNEAINLTGHCDGVLQFVEGGEKFILEIKSANSRSYANVVRANKPLDSHLYQASIYSKELDIRRIIYLYVNKDTSDLFEIIADEKDYSIYQEDAYEKIHMINDHVEEETVCRRTCKTATEERALKCEFCSHCFDLL